MKNKNYAQPAIGFFCGFGGSCGLPATYPGFPVPASEVAEYICGIDFIMVATIHKRVERFDTPNPEPVRQWLTAHGIADITTQVGSMVLNYYSGKV